MLYQLNEKIKGVFAWIIVVLVTITFVAFGVEYFLQAKRMETNLALEVNGEAIPYRVFDLIYRRIQQQDPMPLSVTQDIALRKQILDDLIVNSVSLQGARKAGFYITAEETTAAIRNFPQFQENGKFSFAKYRQILAASMYTPLQVQEDIAHSMLIRQQRYAFENTAFALKSEIKRDAALIYETRDYSYIKIPLSLFFDKVKVTEKQEQDYYAAHKQDFTTHLRVVLDYVLLSLENFKAKSAVQEAEIKQYYNENQASFRKPQSWQVKHILYAFPQNATPKQIAETKQKAEKAYEKLAQHPEKFENMVNTDSDDKLTAESKGLLPIINEGENPLADAFNGLTKENSITRPWKTAAGYEIFKVVHYTPSSLIPYEDAKIQIKNQLENEKAQLSYAKAVEDLGELSYQHPDSLQEVAKALNIPILHTQDFTQAGGSDKVTQNPEVVHAAFSKDVKDLRNNSEPIQLTPSSVIVIRIQKILPKESQTFAAVQAKIEKQLQNQLAEQEIQAWSQKLIKGEAKLFSNLNFIKVAHESREGESKQPNIRDLAFSLAKVGQIKSGRLSDGEHFIVRLDNITMGQFSTLDSKQQQQFIRQVEKSYGVADYDIYISELMETAKIKHFMKVDF
ncbi:MAG: hypothetical protein A3F18_00590 [Legionellales bacterium RIFCSPHIGHO2_12_FULL_37_14]|nr:MAG: hypothetical protein A3F18_00590 [Legionellales bacterium RIFCSPHIGHO2_12_FULL_37_14]